MKNSVNNYAETIKYWTVRYNKAFNEGDVENIKFTLNQINHFTEKHCKALTDKNTAKHNPINTGSIVRYNGGWAGVSKVTKDTVDLRGILSLADIAMDVPITEVYEDSVGYYDYWKV